MRTAEDWFPDGSLLASVNTLNGRPTAAVCRAPRSLRSRSRQRRAVTIVEAWRGIAFCRRKDGRELFYLDERGYIFVAIGDVSPPLIGMTTGVSPHRPRQTEITAPAIVRSLGPAERFHEILVLEFHHETPGRGIERTHG